MKEVASRMGRSLLPFALCAVLFLTGCFGDPANREACVTANSAPFACVGEEQGLTPEQIEALEAQVDVVCAFLSGNSDDCDWRPMADCVESLTCEELSGGGCQELLPDPAACLPFGIGGQLAPLAGEAP